jgi:hypothetical protein
MSSLQRSEQDAVTEQGPAPAEALNCTEPLYAGDTGTLSEPVRRILVTLLLGPSLDGRRHPKLWPFLFIAEPVVRARLHELFLDLVIDHDQQVAFTRQATDDSLQIPILLRRQQLTFLESALLLFLRQRLTQSEAQGERAVVSRADMLEHLNAFEPSLNQDRAKFERQMETAVDKVHKLNILHKLRGPEGRFEVSPTLKILLSAEQVQALTKTYEAMANAPEAAASEDAESLARALASDEAAGLDEE